MQTPIQTPRGPSPAAIGGQSVPAGLISQQNLRILRGFIESFNFVAGDRHTTRIPGVGYIKKIHYYLTGTLVIASQAASGTFGDPRKLIRQSTTSFGAANRPHDLDGISENIFNQLDVPVINPKSTWGTGTMANGSYPVALEFTVNYPISEVNLLGMVYNGGESTYMTHDLSMGQLTDALTLGASGTATLTNGRVEVWFEWVDDVEPIPEREMVDQQGQTYIEPGQGLWRETSMIKYQQLHTSVELVSANQPFDVDLPRGPIYNRVVLEVYNGTTLDTSDTLLTAGSVQLVSQQIATIRDENLNTLDNDYRITYLKNRPGGVYVLSFLDKTGSGRDLLFSAGLGRIQVKGRLGATTPTAGSRLYIYTETLVSLDRNAAY